MVVVDDDKLSFRFPEVHPSARLDIQFMRTLRVPDDGKQYPLPAGFGPFALRHIEDTLPSISELWRNRGGVIMPMYQSEAMWISFQGSYPMAVKIAAGKINALTGKPWENNLNRNPQDYMVTPSQPWLDGFSTGSAEIRQFVASPLGNGETAEEQLTGSAEWGGMQIIVYPLKADLYEKEMYEAASQTRHYLDLPAFLRRAANPDAMGLGLGGRIRQTIFADQRRCGAWETDPSRCFIHILNSKHWCQFTGEPVPQPPVTQRQYRVHGIPWFDYYDDRGDSLRGSGVLAKLKTFAQLRKPRRDNCGPADTDPN